MNHGPYTEEHGAFSSDLQRLLVLALFALRAVARRRIIALTVLITTMLVAAMAAMAMPRMYRVTTRVLTHKAYMLPALVSPRRAVPIQADTPTVGAVEMVKSRDHLLAILEDARVIQTWSKTRPAVGRLKDAVSRTLLGELTDEEIQEALLQMLDKRLIAYVEGNVVVLQIEWHDSDVALAISESAQKLFLDRKRDAELSEVRETLGILEENLRGAQEAMERSTEDFKAVLAAKLGVPVVPGREVRTKTVRVRTGTEGMAANDAAQKRRLERDLADFKQALEGEEAVYRRKLDEANSALAALRQTLGPDHPNVQRAVRLVEERTAMPAHLVQSRAREIEIGRELRRLDERSGRSSYETIEVPEDAAVDEQGRVGNEADPEVERALRGLQQRIARFSEFETRLEDARTELASAQVAFNYRYVVTLPPLYPKKPVAPNVPLILLAGLVAGLLLAFAVALGADLASRRVVESWQVERVSGVPVLGTLAVKRGLLGRGGSGEP
jgi:uncharacterized protein involved in exopolysaccharide biosynthesis